MIEYVEKIKPRISDINYGGHLGHMELLGLLHEVRAQFLKSNNLNEFEIGDCALIMKKLTLYYINQAFWDNELEIRVIIESHKAKIIFKYIVCNLENNNLTAEAEAEMVLLNKRTQKIAKPDLFFERLKYDTKSK
jgi:acyl-CoA thioester hydrolase